MPGLFKSRSGKTVKIDCYSCSDCAAGRQARRGPRRRAHGIPGDQAQHRQGGERGPGEEDHRAGAQLQEIKGEDQRARHDNQEADG